jgi:hypothetical protein
VPKAILMPPAQKNRQKNQQNPEQTSEKGMTI